MLHGGGPENVTMGHCLVGWCAYWHVQHTSRWWALAVLVSVTARSLEASAWSDSSRGPLASFRAGVKIVSNVLGSRVSVLRNETDLWRMSWRRWRPGWGNEPMPVEETLEQRDRYASESVRLGSRPAPPCRLHRSPSGSKEPCCMSTHLSC